MPPPPSPQYSPMGHAIIEPPHLSENLRAPLAAAALPVAMPLGKYHPSNYKNKVKIPEKLVAQTASAAGQSKHGRKNSDIKKKLQQYQRDMVEQAAMAGRMQIPGMKPISPRLLPLNSPGPVTPIELEESGGYLAVGTKSGLPSASPLEVLVTASNPKGQESYTTI